MNSCRKPFSLNQLLDDLESQTRGLAEEKELELQTSFDDRMPDQIVGDPDRIKQIALNLIANAIKFTDEGHIKVSITKQGRDDWELAVSDTGVGIPSHAQDYIFDEFRQVDSSSRRKYSGTGLGLAIVRNFVMMMGGNVRVRSKVGEGSTFSVKLPLHTEVESEETQS